LWILHKKKERITGICDLFDVRKRAFATFFGKSSAKNLLEKVSCCYEVFCKIFYLGTIPTGQNKGLYFDRETLRVPSNQTKSIRFVGCFWKRPLLIINPIKAKNLGQIRGFSLVYRNATAFPA